MTQKFSFNNKEYTAASIAAMSVDDLLSLRNLIAENLGLARIKGFKDHAIAVSATEAALKKYEDTMNQEAAAGNDAPAPKAEKPKVEKAPRETPKCYSAETVKRPTRKMFGRIKKIGMPEKSQRPFAWDSFTNGMRLIDIKEDPNLHAGKISFWMRQDPPLIGLVDIPDDQFEIEMDAWYLKHGFVNPTKAKDAEKAEKAENAAKAKAVKEAKAAEAKAAKEAKTAEAKAAKEAKEAAKAAKVAEPKTTAAPAAEKTTAAPAPVKA